SARYATPTIPSCRPRCEDAAWRSSSSKRWWPMRAWRVSRSSRSAVMSPRCSGATPNGATCSPSPIAESARQAREIDRGDAVQDRPPKRACVVKRDAGDLERAPGHAELHVGVTAPPPERPLRDLDRLKLHPRGHAEARRKPATAHVDVAIVESMAIVTPEEVL